MDADDLPPLDPAYADAPADPEALDHLGAPLCEACGSLEPMQPAGTAQRPYWTCSACGAVRLA